MFRGTYYVRTRAWIALAVAATAVFAIPSVAYAEFPSQATADQDGASASAIDLGNGAIVVSRSSAGGGEAQWEALRFGDTTVLGQTTGPSGDEWTGEAAALGPVLDDLNENGCVRVPDNAELCVFVLDGFTLEDGESSSAAGELLLVQASAGLDPETFALAGLQVGGSSAGHFDSPGCAEGNALSSLARYAVIAVAPGVPIEEEDMLGDSEANFVDC
jgi:hypothetical protein